MNGGETFTIVPASPIYGVYGIWMLDTIFW